MKMANECRVNISPIMMLLDFVHVRSLVLTSCESHINLRHTFDTYERRFKKETLLFETHPHTCPTGAMRANHSPTAVLIRQKGTKGQPPLKNKETWSVVRSSKNNGIRFLLFLTKITVCGFNSSTCLVLCFAYYKIVYRHRLLNIISNSSIGKFPENK